MKAEGKRSLAREPLSPESLAWTFWGLALKQILSKYASVYRKCVSVATLDSAPGGGGGGGGSQSDSWIREEGVCVALPGLGLCAKTFRAGTSESF